MADVDTGDVLRLGTVWRFLAAYDIANVWYVRVTAGGGLGWGDAADDMAEYAADIYDEIDTYLTNNMATSYLTLQNVTQDTTYGAFSWAAPITGGASEENTALGVACLTWARTYKPRVQIRKYFGVFTEAMMSDGLWVATCTSACAAAMAIHTASFVGTNGLTVLGVAYNRTLGTTTDATSIATTSEPAYQRRRKRGSGS